MKKSVSLISAFLIVLILTTGCFGSGEAEPTAVPTTEQAQASEPTATIAAAATPAAEASATEAPTAEAAAPAAGETLDTALTVEDVPEITSYRMRVVIVSQATDVTNTVHIEGAYIKEPPTEQIEILFTEGDQTQRIETILVDGTRYTSFGDAWTQTPESSINVGELTLLTPNRVADLLGEMEFVGTENVGGLSAAHYRGDKEMIPVFGTESDTLDVTGLESAQLDVWVDETYNAVISIRLEASDTSGETPVQLTMTYDYIDLNSDIEIVAPVTAAEPVATPQAAGDFVPRNELGEMLGFNFMFPVDSTVETVSGTNLYVIVTPFTLEEAPAFLEQNMQSNGYSLLSKSELDSGEIVYLYQKDQKVYSVTLSDAGDGKTRFQFATG